MDSIKKSFLLAAEVIKKSQNILLIPHAKMDCDGMSSAIALHDILTKMGKNPTAVCPDPVPDVFSFLPHTEIFKTEVEKLGSDNTILLTLDTAGKKFSDLQYEIKDGKVNILISSENSPFEEADFSFVEQSLQPDLIICLDSGDIKQLGKIYNDNTELFSSIPVLNIDHHISNTQFGTVNLVEMKNSSTTEIIYDLIPYIDERGHDLISEDIATLLLAGLITDTGSFQHSNTTPKSLDTAAELIELGARQQEIIKHLFKTKSLATLRLWGRVLTQLKSDPIYRMVWSSVSREDLEDTLSHSEDAEGLIDELLSTTPGTEMVFLVKEREDGLISTSIRTSSSLVDATLFAEKFGGGGHRQAAGFKIRERGGKSFEEIVADIISEGKRFQAERLGLPLPMGNIAHLKELTDAQPDIHNEPSEVKDLEEKDEEVFPDLPHIITAESAESVVNVESRVNKELDYQSPQEDILLNLPEEEISDIQEKSEKIEDVESGKKVENKEEVRKEVREEDIEDVLFLETSPAEEVIKNNSFPKGEEMKIDNEEISEKPEKIVESVESRMNKELDYQSPQEDILLNLPEEEISDIQEKSEKIEDVESGKKVENKEEVRKEVREEDIEDVLFLETSPAEEVIKNNSFPKGEEMKIDNEEISEKPEKIVESFVDMLGVDDSDHDEELIPQKELHSPLKTEEVDLPDFLKPENIEDTFVSHDESVEMREQREKKEENLLTSFEDDEFAMFLENAQEKKEDDKFDTSYYQSSPQALEQESSEESSEEHSLDSIFEDTFAPNNSSVLSDQGDDFLNFLNEENQDNNPIEEKKTVIEPLNEEFGDDFLQALKQENPELSPIESPAPEIFEIEKPSS